MYLVPYIIGVLMQFRFINTGFNNGYYNMALDEVILESVLNGTSPPTIRFYGWHPHTISIGYFQSAKKELNINVLKNKKVPFVRRPTGGLAVFHSNDLTYSIFVKESDFNIKKSVLESYNIFKEALVYGFLELGINTTIVNKACSTKNAAAACFETPSIYELMANGKKVVGSSKVRRKGTIMQHGSIPIAPDIDMFFECLNFENESIREIEKSKYRMLATSISEILGYKVSFDKVSSAFKMGFKKGLNITFYDGVLSSYEEENVEKLRFKYANDLWNFKK